MPRSIAMQYNTQAGQQPKERIDFTSCSMQNRGNPPSNWQGLWIKIFERLVDEACLAGCLRLR